MKTSISDIFRTEQYLQGRLAPEEEIVFAARQILDARLRRDTAFHALVHRLVRFYHRKKLKNEVRKMHERLINDPARLRYRLAIQNYFKS